MCLSLTFIFVPLIAGAPVLTEIVHTVFVTLVINTVNVNAIAVAAAPAAAV